MVKIKNLNYFEHYFNNHPISCKKSKKYPEGSKFWGLVLRIIDHLRWSRIIDWFQALIPAGPDLALPDREAPGSLSFDRGF